MYFSNQVWLPNHPPLPPPQTNVAFTLVVTLADSSAYLVARIQPLVARIHPLVARLHLKHSLAVLGGLQNDLEYPLQLVSGHDGNIISKLL